MSGIRYSQVILGGLVAGLVINAIEFVMNTLVLADSWAQVMRTLNKPETPTTEQIVLFNLWGFIMGTVAVWTYAAFRSRFGPGARTAIIAGCTTWITGYALAIAPPAILQMFPLRLVFLSAGYGLVEIIAATLAGSSIYKEETADSSLVTRAAKV